MQSAQLLAGRYHLQLRLAGGDSTLTDKWLADDIIDHSPVMIKRLKPSLQPEAFSQRLVGREFLRLQEAQRVQSSSLVRLLCIHDEVPELFAVMEYIREGTVSGLLDDQPQSLDDVCSILRLLRPIAVLLDELHTLGIIHGDVKPTNLLRRADGSLVLCDLGPGESENGNPTTISPTHCAPEQASGKQWHAATDQYGLGVVVFQWVVGTLPFSGSDEELLAAHTSHPAPSAGLTGPLAPLNEILTRVLQKAPGARFDSVTEFIDAALTALSPGDEKEGDVHSRPTDVLILSTGETIPLPHDGPVGPRASSSLRRSIQGWSARPVRQFLRLRRRDLLHGLADATWNLFIGQWQWLFFQGEQRVVAGAETDGSWSMLRSAHIQRSALAFCVWMGIVTISEAAITGAFRGGLALGLQSALLVVLLVLFTTFHRFRPVHLELPRPGSAAPIRDSLIRLSATFLVPSAVLVLFLLRLRTFETSSPPALFPLRTFALVAGIFLLGTIGRWWMRTPWTRERVLLLGGCALCFALAYWSDFIPLLFMLGAIALMVVSVNSLQRDINANKPDEYHRDGEDEP